MTDKPFEEKQPVSLDAKYPEESKVKNAPAPKSVNLVEVKAVWKKPQNNKMLVSSSYGFRVLPASHWTGQTHIDAKDLEKYDEPFDFAKALDTVLWTPEEVQEKLYKAGIVEVGDLDFNVVQILLNQIKLNPLEVLERILKGL